MNHSHVNLGLVPPRAVPAVGSRELAEKEKEWAEATRMGIGWWEAILTPKQGERLIKVYEGRDSIYTLSLQEYGIYKCAKCGGSDNLKVCPMVEVRYPTDPATNYTHFYEVRGVAFVA